MKMDEIFVELSKAKTVRELTLKLGHRTKEAHDAKEYELSQRIDDAYRAMTITFDIVVKELRMKE